MLTFPLHVSSLFAHPNKGERLLAGREAPHLVCVCVGGGGGGGVAFINYLCLQAKCTIVMSETLTFSISPRFGASYKVHCKKRVLTPRMIWKTEIPLSFIIYPGWPRGRRAVALSYLTG